MLVKERVRNYNIRTELANRSSEASSLCVHMDSFMCAAATQRRDSEGLLINGPMRAEEDRLRQSAREFVERQSEKIIAEAAQAKPGAGQKAAELKQALMEMDSMSAAELLFAIKHTGSDALLGADFINSVKSMDPVTASSLLYEIRLTGNTDALTDRRLFSERAKQFFKEIGAESASEWFNSIGKTGNVEALANETVFSDDVSGAIKGNGKIASELSFAIGVTGRQDALVSQEFIEFIKSAPKDIVSEHLSAIWCTGNVDALSSRELVAKIGSGEIDVWKDAVRRLNPESDQAPEKKIVISRADSGEHDRGAKLVVQSLMSEGFDVIYAGDAKSYANAVEIAIKEGARAVGFSIIGDSSKDIVMSAIETAKLKGAEDIVFFGGGMVSQQVTKALEQKGMVFLGPGSAKDDLLSMIAKSNHRQLGPGNLLDAKAIMPVINPHDVGIGFAQEGRSALNRQVFLSRLSETVSEAQSTLPLSKAIELFAIEHVGLAARYGSATDYLAMDYWNLPTSRRSFAEDYFNGFDMVQEGAVVIKTSINTALTHVIKQIAQIEKMVAIKEKEDLARTYYDFYEAENEQGYDIIKVRQRPMATAAYANSAVGMRNVREVIPLIAGLGRAAKARAAEPAEKAVAEQPFVRDAHAAHAQEPRQRISITRLRSSRAYAAVTAAAVEEKAIPKMPQQRPIATAAYANSAVGMRNVREVIPLIAGLGRAAKARAAEPAEKAVAEQPFARDAHADQGVSDKKLASIKQHDSNYMHIAKIEEAKDLGQQGLLSLVKLDLENVGRYARTDARTMVYTGANYSDASGAVKIQVNLVKHAEIALYHISPQNKAALELEVGGLSKSTFNVATRDDLWAISCAKSARQVKIQKTGIKLNFLPTPKLDLHVPLCISSVPGSGPEGESLNPITMLTFDNNYTGTKTETRGNMRSVLFRRVASRIYSSLNNIAKLLG